MSEIANSICPSCNQALKVEYILLGAPAWCNGCLSWNVPKIPPGGFYPVSGCHLSFDNFLQLQRELPAQALLRKWFGYEVEGQLIRNDRGEAIDPVWLHCRIQEDEEMRGVLYNTAMDLWR